MNYDALKTAHLQQMCRDRGLKTSRAKAEMVERLEKYDQDAALTELVSLTEEMGLYDDVTPSEIERLPVVQEESERPVQDDTELEDGAFFLVFPNTGFLTTEQHMAFRRQTEETAQARGYTIRGEAFRVNTGFSDQWEYRVWVQLP